MTNLLSREYLELVRARLLPGGVFYYNTTFSAAAQKTAVSVFPHAWRVQGFVAVSDAPIAFDKARWRRVMETFRLDGRPFTVGSVDTKPYTSRPKAPFTTSTLQQVGGSRLRMSAQQVMRVAQGLYERGYITYMRTDSTTLSDTALAASRSAIEAKFGREYLTDSPRTYAKKAKNAQEAHEAIRPAGESFRAPDELRGELDATDLRLYLRHALLALHEETLEAADALIRFAAKHRTVLWPGYTHQRRAMPSSAALWALAHAEALLD